MHVVSSTFFLRNLRNLNFFTLDLGKSKKVVGKDELRPVDDFIIKYNFYDTKVQKNNILIGGGCLIIIT